MSKKIFAALIMFAIVMQAQLVFAEEHIEKINTVIDGKMLISSQFENISGLSNSGKAYASSAMMTETREHYPAIIAYDRIGIVSDHIAEYAIKLKVGPGKYDEIVITNFVKEKYPYRTTVTKAMDMSLGQSLTPILYREKAIEAAKNCDCAVFLIGRRENNINLGLGLNDSEINSIMKKWDNDQYLLDLYYGVVISKIQTGLLVRKNPDDVKVTVWGHSLGAKNWDDYDKMDYDKKPFGSIIQNIEVDMIMGYDPIYQDPIATQSASYNEIKQAMNNGKFYSDEGATIIYMTSLAANPQTANEKSELPGLTDYANIHVFRMMNFATWQFGSPYTPNFHYLDGDITELYNVDEQEMMAKILNGGVAPYTPLFEDLVVAGQLGGIPEFQTDASKTDVDLIGMNFRGGMDYYGEYSVRQTAEIKNSLIVTTMWYNVGGHASIIFSENKKVDKFWRDTSKIVKEVK